MIEPDHFRFGLKALFIRTALRALWLFDFAFGNESSATPIVPTSLSQETCVTTVVCW
jgi:hypothetical protein